MSSSGFVIINHLQREVAEYQLSWSLLEFLKEQCSITSPKDGCSGKGQCGACVVFVDGNLRQSCNLKMEKALGVVVTTLEGVPKLERELLSRCFAACGAVQCGYCTPGLLMRTKAILDEQPDIQREQIRAAINLHICRCTGYMKIIEAIEMARDHWPMRRFPTLSEDCSLGASPAKYEALLLALGERTYLSDMEIPGMLHGAVVLTPAPRVRVIGIDASHAIAASGVERVLTAGDVPGERVQGLLVKDWPLFVAEGEITSYTGNILAMVVAETARQARAAAKLVEVEVEPLEGVYDVEQALLPAAPRLHPGGNLLKRQVLRWGDLEAAEKKSAFIESDVFDTQFIEHAFMETEAALANLPEGPSGPIDLYTQSQGVFEDRRQVASFLGEPEEQVRVHLVSPGGAFGGKEDLSIQGHVALAARLCGRAVKMALNREESIRIHPKRHPIRVKLQVGCEADGKLTFVRGQYIGDTGAYASVGTKVLERALGHGTGAYTTSAVELEALTVYTNNPPCGAMRGFGSNQANFALESLLDRLAEKVGLDGFSIRWLNALEDGHQMTTGQRVHACGLKDCLKAVEQDYKSARYAGIACGIKNVGIGNSVPDVGRVTIRVGSHGQLEVFVGHSEMGQGLYTIAQQIVAQELSIPLSHICVRTNTLRQLDCGITTSSRGTVLMGNALANACAKLKERLGQVGSLEELEGLEVLGEYVCDFTTPIGGPPEEVVTHLAYGFTAQVCILDEKGRIERFVAAQDVGRVMNRALCEGQIQGGVHMGLGGALTEELVLDQGVPRNPTLGGLGIIRPKHLPLIEVKIIEEFEKNSVYGSKGVGELPLVPVASAVAGALYAFDGVRRNRLPMKDTTAARGIKGQLK